MKKKIISGIAAIVMTATMAATASAQKLGDVNGESKIDIEDAVSVINHVNGQKSVGYKGSASADVNSDGKIDIEDAVLIINNINGLSAIEDKDVSPAPVEMTVDKLLSRNGAQLRALSFDDFEIIQGQGQTQWPCIRCAAFPNYGFVVDYTVEDGKAEGPYQFPMNFDPEGKHGTITDKIKHYELFDGAYIGNGVTVGMTYNQIKEAMGGELKIHIHNSSLGYAANVEIDGRTWLLHFDLTLEQKEEISKRITDEYAKTGSDDPNGILYIRIDISDINPKCDLAIYSLE